MTGALIYVMAGRGPCPKAEGMNRELRSRTDVIRDRSDLTIPALFAERLEMSPDIAAYKVNDGSGWQAITWRAMGDRVGHLRAALRGFGLTPGDRIGLWLENGIDWIACDIAVISEGFVTVPLYMRDSGANIGHVIQNAGLRLCIVDKLERWRGLVAEGHALDSVTGVWAVGFDPIRIDCLCPSENSVTALREPDSIAWTADEAQGHLDRAALATIVYTSGTTGAPKGVMLSHQSILSNADAVMQVSPVYSTDVFLSLLPLAHGFERTLGCYLPMMGCATVAFNRSIESLRDDLVEVKPTLLLAVPRLFERIVAAVRAEAGKSFTRAWMLSCTERVGRWPAKSQKRSWLARVFWALVGNRVSQRVRDVFGGRLRMVLSGGAPLSTETFNFMASMGVPLVEGYGLTEAGPAVTGSTLKDRLPGSVGRPLPGVQVKLGKRDELLVRTPSIMLGYWSNSEATSEIIDQNGWLHTGDIAELNDGRIFIRGRLKDILVLSTGENVNLNTTEKALLSDPLVDQVCVLGDRKPWCCAVVVLSPAEWQAFAGSKNLDPSAPNSPTARQALIDHLSERMLTLPPFARVRDLHVELKPWTLDSGLITPTLKAKRQKVADKYEHLLATLYEH